jgi:hypothetical protein
VAAWHLFFLLPQWCLILPLHGWEIGHKKMWIQFKHFLVGNQENLKKEFSLQSQVLATGLSFVFFPQIDLLVHKHFFCSLIFEHAKEYF